MAGARLQPLNYDTSGNKVAAQAIMRQGEATAQGLMAGASGIVAGLNASLARKEREKARQDRLAAMKQDQTNFETQMTFRQQSADRQTAFAVSKMLEEQAAPLRQQYEAAAKRIAIAKAAEQAGVDAGIDITQDLETVQTLGPQIKTLADRRQMVAEGLIARVSPASVTPATSMGGRRSGGRAAAPT